MITENEIKALLDQGLALHQIIQTFTQDIVNLVLLVEAKQFIDDHQAKMADGSNRLELNGSLHHTRPFLLPAQAVQVNARRVRDNSPVKEKLVFNSKHLPKYLSRDKDVAKLVPWLFLRGISESEFQPFFELVYGEPVEGFSQASVSRMFKTWEKDYEAWSVRDLSEEVYPYLWADGMFLNVKGERDNHCQLVVLGADLSGKKRLVGMAEGFAEGAETWSGLFSGFRERGMQAPKVVVGDAALGLWSGLGKVFPDSARQHCWVHKTRDVMGQLPKHRYREARLHLRQIWLSDTRDYAVRASRIYEKLFELKSPKAVETVTRRLDELLTFFDFPAEHWTALRTSNPIESFFSTLRLRTVKTRACVNRGRVAPMVFKLAETASENLKSLGHADKLALVMAGVRFKDGEKVE